MAIGGEKLGEAILELRTDDKRYRRGMAEAEKSAGRLEKQFKQVGSVLAGVFAGRQLFRFVSESVRLADEQAEALSRVASVIESQGRASEISADQVSKMASAMQQVTRFGDETILAGQAILLSFKSIGSDIFPQATEAMLDLATVMQTDLRSAAIQVGKVLGDPAKQMSALSRSGIIFTEEQKKVITILQETGRVAEAQTEVLRVLAENGIGGAARAAAEAGSGPLVQFQNKWGDIRELLGGDVLRVLLDVVGGIGAIIAVMPQASEGVGVFTSAWVSAHQVISGAALVIIRGVEGIALANAKILEIAAKIIPAYRDEAKEARAAAESIGRFADAFRDVSRERIDKILDDGAKSAAGLSDAVLDVNVNVDGLGETTEETGEKADEAAAAAKKLADELQGIVDSALPIESEIREITSNLEKLTAAMGLEGVDAARLDELQRAYQSLVERLLELDGAAIESSEAVDLVVKPEAVARQEALARALGVTTDAMDDMRVDTDSWADSLGNVADLIDMAFGDLDSDLADTAREIVRMIDSVTRLAGAWDDLSKAQKAAGVAGIAGQAVDLFGLGGEGEKSGAFGGSGGGDYADVGAQAGAVIGAVIGAAIAGYFTGGLFAHEGAVIGAAIGGLIGEVIGGFINRGADEGLGQLQLIAGEIETKVLRDEGGLGKAIQSIGDAVIENLNRVTDLLQVTVESLPTVDIKVRGENIVAKVGEYRRVFQDIDEAIQFLVTETLRAAEFSGGIDEAFTQILEAGRFGDLEGLQEQLSLIDQLVTAEKIFVQGLSEMEVQLEGLPRKLSLMRTELENMGLSADQVTRLSGAAAVQAFAQARQAITGEQLSVEQRRQIAESQRQLFNAQMELEIAEHEAKKAALLAEAGLTEQQVALINAQLGAQSAGLAAEGKIAQARTGMQSNVIHAEERFLQARGKLATAELGVMGGFTHAAAGIVQAGAGMLGSFADALAQLPEEIAAQVKAIQSVIDALKRIGTIKAGDIRIPGAPSFERPSFERPGGPTRGVSGPADDARRAILDLIESLTDLASQTEETIGRMESAVEDLVDFRAGLLVGPVSPLPPGQQLDELERQLAAAQAAFIGGDVAAGADIQRLAQQFLQLSMATFGAAGPGFQSRFRDIQDILGETIGEGNQFTATELEELQALRSTLADLLENNRSAHDLTKEQTRAIREGDADNRQEIKNVREAVDDMNDDFSSELASLRRAIVELAEAA